jgi:putative endonuclease
MAQAKDAVGAYGERVAVAYLVAHGMVLIARNWRCAAGEIDAVLLDGEVIVFTEVKTRRSTAFGTPAESIGYAKQARLRRLAAAWLAQSDHQAAEIRFDIVSVLPQRHGAALVEHVPAAF